MLTFLKVGNGQTLSQIEEEKLLCLEGQEMLECII